MPMEGDLMEMKRVLAGAVCAGALVVGSATAAFGGEVTGPVGSEFATGKPTPIASYVAHSICSFSGLNAFHPGKEGVYPGHVQSYGQLVKIGQKDANPSPGEACNGHTGELTQPPPQP